MAAPDSRATNAVSSPIALMSGAGNTTVVFFSTPSSASVCKLRNCSARGWRIIVADASPSAAAARASPSAAMIFARFERSASASRAMARFMLSGNWMSLSSTKVTSMPQLSVVVSGISRMLPLITDVSASTSSSECYPTTLRKVVCAIWSIAAATFSMVTTALPASTTRK